MMGLKYVFGTAVLAVVCAACEKDSAGELMREECDRIVFDTPALMVETVTRSTLKDALVPGDEFGVLGYCVPYTVGTQTPNYNAGASLWALKKALCPPDVFYKQRVVVGTGGCTYDRNGGTGNNPKYWYRDGYDTDNAANAGVTGTDDYRYSFVAYYPYSGAFTVDKPETGQTAGAPVLTFTMPQTGTDVAAPLDHRATPDAMLAVLYNSRKSDGNLRFNFSHVLTGLGFEVNNFSGYDLEVKSVTLSGSFYKKVRIDLTGDVSSFSFPGDRYTGTYTLFDGDASGGSLMLPAPDASLGETVTSSPSPIGGEHVMLISGTGTSFGENVKVRIEYVFNGVPNVFETARPGTFTPQPGIKYTAQLNFVGDTFVLQFVVDNQEQWEDGEADDEDETNDDVIFE